MIKTLQKIYLLQSIDKKKEFWKIVFLMILVSFIEVVSIGSVAPLMTVLVSDNLSESGIFTVIFSNLLLYINKDDILIFFIIFFLIAITFATIGRVFLLRKITRFGFSVGADVALKVYDSIMSQNFEMFVKEKTSDVITNATTKSNQLVAHGVLPAMNILGASATLISVLLVLMAINLTGAIFLLFFVAFFYKILLWFHAKKLKHNSSILNKRNSELVELIKESSDGVRDRILNNSNSLYVSDFKIIDTSLREAQATNKIISASPRHYLEGVLVYIFLFTLVILMSEKGFTESLPVLTVFVLAAQRSLPYAQQIFVAISSFKGYREVIEGVLHIVKNWNFIKRESVIETSGYEISSFENLSIKKLKYSHHDVDHWALKIKDFNLKAGERVGIIGPSGSGKSTFLDVVMGFLKNYEGEFYINNKRFKDLSIKSWRSKISLVPQNIHIYSGTILDNIILNNVYSKSKFEDVLKTSGLHEFVTSLINSEESLIGESSNNLSGGQRQRIGIARALYKNPDILILDEATSALNSSLEKSILYNIFSKYPEMTILIVSHSYKVLDRVDRVILIENGEISNNYSVNEFEEIYGF
jgi:ATP-binding cassette, subfamily B, bacterial PglK